MGGRLKKKHSFTIHLSTELIERVKDIVYWTPGLTLSGLTQDSLEEMAARYERKNGGRFPHRQGNIKPGRPLE